MKLFTIIAALFFAFYSSFSFACTSCKVPSDNYPPPSDESAGTVIVFPPTGQLITLLSLSCCNEILVSTPTLSACQTASAPYPIGKWYFGLPSSVKQITRICEYNSYSNTYITRRGNWSIGPGPSDPCPDCSSDPSTQDTDGDGFPDNCDLEPNSPIPAQSASKKCSYYSLPSKTCCEYKVTYMHGGILKKKYVPMTCPDGPKGMDINVSGPSGSPDAVDFGEPSSQSEVCQWFNGESSSEQSSSESPSSSASSNPAQSGQQAYANSTSPSIDESGNVTGMPTGQTADYGNSTDTNRAIVENQNTQIGQANDAAVKEAIEDQQEQEAAEDAISGIGGLDPGAGLDSTLPPPDDYEDEGTLTSILTSLATSSPVADIIASSGISASDGGCSYSGTVTIGSRSISPTISFCGWESSLETMGAILYALAQLVAILIILGMRF